MVRVCWARVEGGRGSARTTSPARAEPTKASGSPGDGSAGVSGGGDVAAHVVNCGLGRGQPRRVRPIPRHVSRVDAEADVGDIVYLGYSGLGRARESRRQRATGNGACQALLQSAGPFLTRRGSQVPRQAETAYSSSWAELWRAPGGWHWVAEWGGRVPFTGPAQPPRGRQIS